MKRDFLEGLGIDKENIDKIMTENGKDIEGVKTNLSTKEQEVSTLRTQLDNANKEIEGFKDLDVEGIKKASEEYKAKFEEAQTQAEKEILNLKFEHELEGAIRDSKAKNIKAVKALLDIDTLKESTNRVEDIKKALETTKIENDFLFGEVTPGGTGGSQGNGKRETPPTDEVNYGKTLAEGNAKVNTDTSAYEI